MKEVYITLTYATHIKIVGIVRYCVDVPQVKYIGLMRRKSVQYAYTCIGLQG